ncbi:MAG: hypothetical protein K8F52_08795 [Candidatus Scalindua rubra]|uniref:GGDEF domain-containing protein n=1 Tax=Candidatus Scalindua brodae TaxID=237368 RepID=A0A0B0EPC2_9BACT|nr:MAG: hypothetical protein SCABRO_01765 [Candidatus Scalindua brodae]MBZ0108756.1 hypothetical protein [Candidatus Scalindua rubra]TWU30947.1 hypothetical protein S225a_23900 [Candidatus Brocadiaceae bacterium S225]
MCVSNGMLPAQTRLQEDNKTIFISAACKKKREKADEGKNSFFEEFVRFIEGIKREKNPELWKQIEENNWHTLPSNDYKGLFPKEINAIGAYSNEYIGLIYADGNRMGQRLQERKCRDEYTEFSDRILEGTKSAIFEALATNLKLEHQFPFEILLLGGDDLLLIVPADKAIDVAIDFCDTFRSNLTVHDVSISAGVVITHANYPIHQMINYGEQLLKSAKRKGNETPEKEENYIDFMVIKNPIHHEVFNMRENEMTYWSEERERLQLFQRPYTTENLKDIINKIKRLKYENEGTFPRSRLKQMYQSLFRGKNQAMLDYCLLLSRLDKDTRWIMKDAFFTCCDLFPWQRTDDGLETPFLDIIELYDFIT